jgi:HEAT repeat protein
MGKNIQQRVFKLTNFGVASVLLFSSFLILNPTSWTQQVKNDEIEDYLKKCERKYIQKQNYEEIPLPQNLGIKSVDILINQLGTTKAEARIKCISYSFKAAKKEAVEPLITFLNRKNNSPESLSGAADALGYIGEDASAAIPTLKELLKNNQLFVPLRISAAKSLRKMGIYESDAVQALGDALKDLNADKRVGEASADALGNIGKNKTAKEKDINNVVSTLRDGLRIKGQKAEVRIAIANAFGNIGNNAYEAIPILINVAQDRNEKNIEVRISAVRALGKINYNPKTTVNELLNIWRDSQERVNLLTNIADALGNLGKDSEDAIPPLIKVLKNTSTDTVLRSHIIDALKNINPKKEEVSNCLVTIFKSSNEPTILRVKSAEALGETDIQNEKIFSVLFQSIRSQDKDNKVYISAVDALINIAKKYQSGSKDISRVDLEKAINKFKEFHKILKNNQEDNDINKRLKDLEAYIEAIENYKKSRIFDKVVQSVSQHSGLMGILFYSGTGLSISLFLLIFRPIWLLKINDFLKPLTLPDCVPVIGGKMSLSYVLFLRFFNYHNRVLDAWVAQHLKSFQQEFSIKDTVSDREIHIPVPVYINDTSIAELKAQNIRSIFKKQRECILIWGEAGSGKTSLACQIAKWAMSDDESVKISEHPMLPVLIEEELGVENNEKQKLLSVIRGQIQDLTNEKESISEELLQHLLRQRKILVIVDRYSELSDATRKAISPDSPDFPVNALIVTSRFPEHLGKVTKSVIEPMRIEGNFLSSFMEAYLSQRGKRKLFDDKDFFDACSRLSTIVGEGRTVTVLIAKCYAEQLIANKEGRLDTPFSTNIPDLMLSCLNETNRTVIQNKLSDRIVQKDAKAIAWECVKASFLPGAAKREDILNVLQGEDAELRLEYLEKRLRIIQTINPAQDSIRFTLDPLAEYLAGLHLVDIYNNNEKEWKTFIQQIEEISKDANSVKGFLLAVQDCSVAKNTNENTKKVPDFLIKELEKYTGLQALS